MPNRSGLAWSSFFRRARRSPRRDRAQARALARIESWTFPFSDQEPAATPVHAVTGEEDWHRTAWMLASWFHFTERAWPLTVHDDGSLSDAAAAKLQQLFPAARIIRRPEADAALTPVLLAFPYCETFRNEASAALNIFDTRHFCTAPRYFVFDSDVLFFNYPRELVDWAESGSEECWFAEGIAEFSLVTPAEARDELGIRIWPRADAAISLLHRSALDLDFFDSALAQTSILRGPAGHAAGTLAMLGAARHGQGGLLPRTYEVSLARIAAAESVGRHYSEPVRERFVADGLARVAPHLFPRDP